MVSNLRRDLAVVKIDLQNQSNDNMTNLLPTPAFMAESVVVVRETI